MGGRHFVKSYHDDRACCGMKLRRATILVGILEVIYFFIALLSSLQALWDWKVHVKASPHILMKNEESGQFFFEKHDEKEQQNSVAIVLTLTSTLLCVGIITALILIAGVQRASSALCQIWMAVKVILVTMAAIHLMLSQRRRVVSWGIGAYIFDGLLIAFSIPAFVAVYSFVDELKRKEREGPVSGTAVSSTTTTTTNIATGVQTVRETA